MGTGVSPGRGSAGHIMEHTPRSDPGPARALLQLTAVAPSSVGLFYDMSSGDKAPKMGPSKGKERRRRTARIVIGGTAGHCRGKERERKKERGEREAEGEMGGREQRRHAVFHPHFPLRLSPSLSLSLSLLSLYVMIVAARRRRTR